MVRAFEPKKYYIEHSRASKKSSWAKPSFWKHPAREPNFEPSLGSTQPYLKKAIYITHIHTAFFPFLEHCTWCQIDLYVE